MRYVFLVVLQLVFEHLLGKTAVSVALSHLFGFGHTQSDDIQAKKAAPVFINKVTNLLKKNDVVIADKWVICYAARFFSQFY